MQPQLPQSQDRKCAEYLSENTFSYLSGLWATPWQHSMYNVVVILHLSHHLPWPAGLMCKFNESQNMHGPPPRPSAQISPPHVINTPAAGTLVVVTCTLQMVTPSRGTLNGCSDGDVLKCCGGSAVLIVGVVWWYWFSLFVYRQCPVQSPHHSIPHTHTS